MTPLGADQGCQQSRKLYLVTGDISCHGMVLKSTQALQAPLRCRVMYGYCLGFFSPQMVISGLL